MPNFNDSMHRRNLFRKKPDFKMMALDFPELSSFITPGARGKPKFNFKNPNALRALTCALMRHYFHKDISLPEDRLVPAVPQRLNYVCWVEDLVALLKLPLGEAVRGIDIGTGASCIFPILMCHRNLSWSMVATESDSKSYEYARGNVQKNYLTDKIQVKFTDSSSSLDEWLAICSTRPLHFTMCNPPFFNEEFGLAQVISERHSRSESNTSSPMESVAVGGEEEFVGKILTQSLAHREDVMIFTTMLGRKSSLLSFKRRLNDELAGDVSSWVWAEFCQGRTIRYGLAWTFCPSLDLTKAPSLKHLKDVSWTFKLPDSLSDFQSHSSSIMHVASNHLMYLIENDLSVIKNKIVRNNKHVFEVLIKATENTWVNQRRKRREAARKQTSERTSAASVDVDMSDNRSSIIGATDVIDDANEADIEDSRDSDSDDPDEAASTNVSNKLKRKAPSFSTDDNSTASELSASSANNETAAAKKLRSSEQNQDSDEDTYGSKYLIVCFVSLERQDTMHLTVKLHKSFTNNQTAYELFQYLKNKFKDPFW